MAKSPGQDLMLKLRLRRLLFSQGYWAPIEIELSHYEHLGTEGMRRKPLTDLDVLGIRYDTFFTPHRIVGDCKSGKVQDAGRLFWLRGVMDYFGAHQAYFLRPSISNNARSIAPKMGLRVLDETELSQLEKTFSADGFPNCLADEGVEQKVVDLWGIGPVATGSPLSEEQVALKPLFSHLSYTHWYLDAHRCLLALLGEAEKVARFLNPANPRHVVLAHVAAERFALCLLDIANHVCSQGGGNIVRDARTYLYGGPLDLREKEDFFELMRQITKSGIQLDPVWLNEVLEQLGRMIRNPIGAADILRHLFAATIWVAVLGHRNLPELSPGSTNVAAVSLATDIAITFCSVTRFPRDLFPWIGRS